jgi:hypothetical protein
MENKNFLNKDLLAAQVLLLDEMIEEKTSQISIMLENLKRFEGHSSGSKETSEKIGNYIKKQQADLKKMVEAQQLTPEIGKFIEAVLEATRSFVRATCSDVERLYFLKQGEALCTKSELDKLTELKSQSEKKIESLKNESAADIAEDAEQKEESQEVKEEEKSNPVSKTKEKKTRVRPDQDPTTRAGRAAMDIANRRKKYQKKSS